MAGGIATTALVAWTIARCSDHWQAKIYEEIAMQAYGPKMAKYTICMEVMCQLGFVVAYVVLLKTLLPHTLDQLTYKKLPIWISTSIQGQKVWAFVFCFTVILPMSVPRELSSARYSNMVCFIFAVYFSLTIILTCFFDKALVPSLSTNVLDAALDPQMPLFSGIVTCIPLIIFCVMYQQNVPQVYSEITNTSLPKMKQVLTWTTLIVSGVYSMAGFFGYVTWVNYTGISGLAQAQNILMAPYGSTWILIAQLAICAACILVSPLCMLPCKDAIEKLYYGVNGKLSDR